MKKKPIIRTSLVKCVERLEEALFTLAEQAPENALSQEQLKQVLDDLILLGVVACNADKMVAGYIVKKKPILADELEKDPTIH